MKERSGTINKLIYIGKMLFQGSSKTILNIFHNFIPHNAMNCDVRDPPWITKNMKQLITERKTLRSLDKVELATF